MSENGVKCSATISSNMLFFAVLVIETLCIVPSTVFSFLNVFASDEDHYKTYHPELSEIVRFHFLLPIFVYQIVWLLANIGSVVTVHTATPYVFLFTILAPAFGLIISLVILVPSVEYIISHNFNVSSFFMTFVCCLTTFIIGMILFMIVRVLTLRKIMKRKKVVQGSLEKSAEEAEVNADDHAAIRIKDPDEISTSFSRRSTMSMNEERYIPPPRF